MMEEEESARMNLLQTIAIATLVGIIIIKLLSVWRQWTEWRETVKVIRDIDCDPPHWLFGHLRTYGRSFVRNVSLMKKFPKCHLMWIGPFVASIRGYYPDFIKTILSSDYPKDELGYRFVRPWIGDGLLTSHGSKWKRNRRLLTPAFHFGILKKYLICMNDSTTELLNDWCERIRGNSDFLRVEMFEDISRMALDSIVRCILSKQSGRQGKENIEYLQAVKSLTEITMKRMYNPLYHSDFIFYLTPQGRAYKRAVETAHRYTAAAIDERRSHLLREAADGDACKDLAFLDILIRAKDDRGHVLSNQEICDEVDTFLFEGHDTVSSGISWAMYNLAVYPHLQEKCRSEVGEVLRGKHIAELNDLSKLTFLSMFIKESMRLYPPVFGMGRRTNKPIRFSRGFGKDQYNCSAELPEGDIEDFSKEIPKNVTFGIPIYMLHRNPHVWENPSIFDPERFTPENCAKRSPHAYIPFSEGPRNCIGQNFAMTEMKVVLSRTLSTFQIRLDEAHPEPVMDPHIVLRSSTGIHLKLKRIVEDI